MLEYELGEMTGVNGVSLRHEVEAVSSEYAIRISSIIEDSAIVKKLNQKLYNNRVRLYFQTIIKKNIYPFVREGCVIQWYKRNNKHIKRNDCTVRVPNGGVFLLLRDIWEIKDVNIKVCHFKNKFSINNLKNFVKKIIKISSALSFLKRSYSPIPNFPRMIACHYAEGFDFAKRNDLSWFSNSGISPDKVLIYFDNRDNKTGKRIKRCIVDYIEQQGFYWVTLKRNIVNARTAHYWRAPKIPKIWMLGQGIASNKIDRWLLEISNHLLEEVHYWWAFYKQFNIKINYIPEEGLVKSVAQAIAFDMDTGAGGFLIGKQRSEIFLPLSFYLGHHPKHIFFIWNRRVLTYFNPNYEQVEQFVVSGYPNNVSRLKDSNGRISFMKSKGAEFIISLFDNVHSPDSFFSTKEMTKFYQVFLEWLLEDRSIGLVVKSKKPFVINNLPLIRSLLDKAVKTDRCILLDDQQGRFPADASCGVDMAVGIGISSAVMESILMGTRGVHYDPSHLGFHEFYKWGYETLIFDDLFRMVSALREFRDNPGGDWQNLGDWSNVIGEVDPFCDSLGGERMGKYMNWLLEGFDKGLEKDEVIKLANNNYAQRWGAEKIVELNI